MVDPHKSTHLSSTWASTFRIAAFQPCSNSTHVTPLELPTHNMSSSLTCAPPVPGQPLPRGAQLAQPYERPGCRPAAAQEVRARVWVFVRARARLRACGWREVGGGHPRAFEAGVPSMRGRFRPRIEPLSLPLPPSHSPSPQTPASPPHPHHPRPPPPAMFSSTWTSPLTSWACSCRCCTSSTHWWADCPALDFDLLQHLLKQ